MWNGNGSKKYETEGAKMGGLEIIKHFEGCRLKAYPDPATRGKPYTIGYGTTRNAQGGEFKLGETITQEMADAYLVRDFNDCKDELKKDAGLAKLPEPCLDALTSLCYNIGVGAFKRSKCYKAIITGDLETVCKEWNWFKANGKFMKGLARRRIAELGVFLDNV